MTVFFFIVQDDRMTEPLHNKVLVGDDTTFTCESSVEVVWYYRSENEEPVSLYTSQKVLKLTSVTLRNAGYYICYGRFPFSTGVVGKFLSQSILEVLGMFVDVITYPQVLSENCKTCMWCFNL